MDERDIELIRVLQKEDIFLEPSPFERAAGILGWELDEVLGAIRRLKRDGVIRRFGAALTPSRAGFTVNALVAWQVEGEREEEVGTRMASHPRVSHCYLRPTFEGFPYNLYTMVHADSADDLKAILAGLSEAGGAPDHIVLRTLREFKKSSPIYFP